MRMTVTVLSMAAWLICGCLAGDPGGQTRKALSQLKDYEWGEGGRFRVHAVGPQTERFLMLEGEIVMKDDGTPDFSKSTIAYYLSAEPAADQAAGAFAAAIAGSVKQMETMSEAFGKLTDLVATLMPGASAPSADVEP